MSDLFQNNFPRQLATRPHQLNPNMILIFQEIIV
jgi:hypothetical protein